MSNAELVFYETEEYVTRARELLRREWQHGITFTEYSPWWYLGLSVRFKVSGPPEAVERVTRLVEHLKRHAHIDGQD